MYRTKFGFKTVSIMDYNMEYDRAGIAKNYNSTKVAFLISASEDVKSKQIWWSAKISIYDSDKLDVDKYGVKDLITVKNIDNTYLIAIMIPFINKRLSLNSLYWIKKTLDHQRFMLLLMIVKPYPPRRPKLVLGLRRLRLLKI